MGIEHLAEKRTGRPRGSQSLPACRRDARWAYKNWDKEDAVPRSAGAKMWLIFAREHPARFLECVACMESQTPLQIQRAAAAGPNGASDKPSGLVYDGPSRRVKTVPVSESLFLQFLIAEETKGRSTLDVPSDAHVVGFTADVSQRNINLVLQSESFPEVQEEQPIPKVERLYRDYDYS